LLIIEHRKELEARSNDRERQIKWRTLELFHRDSRNVDIITYDELQDRAKFVVEHRSHRQGSPTHATW